MKTWNIHCDESDMVAFANTCTHIREWVETDCEMYGLQLDNVKIFFPEYPNVEELDIFQ